jgi:hypothetical protein
MHEYVQRRKDTMFREGGQVILDRLNIAAASIGKTLKKLVGANLAQKVCTTSFHACFPSLIQRKIEVKLAVLWETVQDDPAQIQVRKNMANIIASVSTQLGFWSEAERTRNDRQAQELEDIEMAEALNPTV